MERGTMKRTWMRRARMRRGKRNNMYTNLSLGYSSSSPVQYWQNDSQHWPNSFPLPLPLPHPRHLLRPLLQFLPLPLPPLLPHCHHHPENNVFQIDITYSYFILILHIDISYRYIILILFQYRIQIYFQKNYDLLKYFYRSEKQINHWSKVWKQKQRYTGK